MNGGLVCKACGWAHYPGRFKPAACEHCGASMEPTAEVEVHSTQEESVFTSALKPGKLHCFACDLDFSESIEDHINHTCAARNSKVPSTKSDGSTASYYQLPPGATELQDLISFRNMNAQLGEIFRAAYRYGQASHSDCLRDAKKIKFYAEAEIARLERYGEKK